MLIHCFGQFLIIYYLNLGNLQLHSKSVLGMSMMSGSQIFYLGLQKGKQVINVIDSIQECDSLGHTRKCAESTR